MKIYISSCDVPRETIAEINGILMERGYTTFVPDFDVSLRLVPRERVAQSLAWLTKEAEGLVIDEQVSSGFVSAEISIAKLCNIPIWRFWRRDPLPSRMQTPVFIPLYVPDGVKAGALNPIGD